MAQAMSARKRAVSAPPTTIEPQRRLPMPRPELQEFARKLNNAMLVKGFSASDLARAVWGTTRDYRGYQVAKGRDRIGNYLTGVSYPNPENLKAIATAVGVKVEDLRVPTRAQINTDPDAPLNVPLRGMHDVNFTMLASHPGIGVISIRQLVGIETGLAILKLLNDDPIQGTVPTDPLTNLATVGGRDGADHSS